MQPLPPSITNQVFMQAANSFQTAAANVTNPTVLADSLTEGARATFQGIPSLRMTTSRDGGGREFATALTDAANAALELAKSVRATPAGQTPEVSAETIRGWAQLTAGAAGFVNPDGFDSGLF